MRAVGVILLAAGLSGAAAVVVGAVEAHLSVGGATTQAGRFVATGLRYHLVHAVALLALAGLAAGVAGRAGSGWPWAIAGCWIGGTVLFSGGLYLRGFAGAGTLGPVIPTGGLLYIAGWVLAAAFGVAAIVRSGPR
jgi:uncharacterized membrane protein YgdD (TMEM256/DUF423 family)